MRFPDTLRGFLVFWTALFVPPAALSYLLGIDSLFLGFTVLALGALAGGLHTFARRGSDSI